jgi:hypothetical protein
MGEHAGIGGKATNYITPNNTEGSEVNANNPKARKNKAPHLNVNHADRGLTALMTPPPNHSGQNNINAIFNIGTGPENIIGWV